MSKLLLAAVATMSLTSMALAQAESATWIGMPFADSCGDITPDGKWIVGTTVSGFPYRFDVEAGSFTALPGGNSATGVSDDGQVIVGDMPDPEDGVEVAGMWSVASNTWTSLGFLPDALNCPSRSNAYDVSGDGSVVTGLSWDGCSGRGFVWTHATGMLELESLANGNNRASAISADGTMIAGFAQGSFSRTPCVWDAVTTDGQLLDPPNGDALGEMQYVSNDGATAYGTYDNDAIRWTEADGMETIGAGSILPGWSGIPLDVADDGTVVGFDLLFTTRRAWIQPQGEGDIIELKSYIESLGATVTDPFGLEVATGISADGKTIIGHNFSNGWRINLEFASCTGDIDGSDDVEFSDLLTILSNWGTDGPGADLAEPTNIVDFSDLLVVLSAWGPCP